MMKPKKYTALYVLLLLLISSSVTLSTLHHHGTYERNYPVTEKTHSVSVTINTTLCPVCGFLANAQTVAPLVQETQFHVVHLVASLPDSDTGQHGISDIDIRGPPFFAV